ncbi:hypothetical protein Ciccas_009127 [Cichlidogyrus casuarinus]|uniref:Uncharacterized protein n=1 Tax=Cichlidogyrus casuarinus TaxID=1844966 RepID=A0ABD2PXY9_9PLAT
MSTCETIAVTDLIQLTAVNGYLRSVVEEFIQFRASLEKLFPAAVNYASDCLHYRRLGLLASVALHRRPVKIQLRFLTRILSLHDRDNYSKGSNTLKLQLYGHFLNVYLRIHTPMMRSQLCEDVKRQCFLSAPYHLRLSTLLKNQPGSFPTEEFRFRQFHRAVFLDNLFIPSNTFDPNRPTAENKEDG